MRIAVCLKQVPDTEARLRVADDGRWIDEQDLAFGINESDEYALEEALTLAERTEGEVTVFCVGPERVRDALRKALALGAARAVHLNDEAFAGGDAAANARALAAAIRRDSFDLVLTGSQSDDTGFAATGSMLAGELGWPHAWLVMGIELEEGAAAPRVASSEPRASARLAARVTREMESGKNEIFRLPLPAVLQVQAGINHPRYASLKGIMQAKKKPIEALDLAAVGLAVDAVGRAGSPTEIVRVAFPESGEGAQMLEGDAATVAQTLVEKLSREAGVLS